MPGLGLRGEWHWYIIPALRGYNIAGLFSIRYVSYLSKTEDKRAPVLSIFLYARETGFKY